MEEYEMEHYSCDMKLSSSTLILALTPACSSHFQLKSIQGVTNNNK